MADPADAGTNADAPTPTDTTEAPVESTTETEAPADLSGLKKALDSERKLRRDAEKRAKALATYETQVKEAEEAKKSDAQKAAEALANEQGARQTAEQAVLRYEVAAERKVPAGLVKFLAGSTREEIEASADALLAELAPAQRNGVPGRPTERLATGQPSSSSLDDEDPMALLNVARGYDPPK